MLNFVFLTQQFYNDHAQHPEIEQKITRPYIMVKVVVNGVLFGVPLRSHITHPYVLWTDKANECGVDFSKAVVIEKTDYIDTTTKPYIRPGEFKSLKGKEYIIQKKLEMFIREYKKAKLNPEIKRNQMLLQFSTLQYFEKYI